MESAHEGWQRIAWQGVSVLIPSEWHVAKLRISRNDGYMRADDDEMMRFELEWVVMAAGQAISLKEQAQAYFSRMAKEFKKRGKEFTHSVDTKLIGRHQVRGRDVLTFSWVGDYVGEGMLWWCDKCGKLLKAQVIGSRGERMKELAKRIFVSISDHSSGDWDDWELFGLNFKVPSYMMLREHKVEAGFVRLLFKHGDEVSFEVTRWSAANILLKGMTLEKWAAQVLREHLRKFDIVYRRGKFNGHDCVELDGKARSPLGTLQLIIRQITKRGPMPKLSGLLWECSETNRLLMSLLIAPPHMMGELAASITSLKCH